MKDEEDEEIYDEIELDEKQRKALALQMCSLVISANVHLSTHHKIITALAEDNAGWKNSQLNLFGPYLENKKFIQCDFFAKEYMKTSLRKNKIYYMSYEMKADRPKAKLFE